MKTYQLHKTPTSRELYMALQGELPFKFKNKIRHDNLLYVNEVNDGVEIGLPLPYEEYLYKVAIVGDKLNISKSEHYTDDVNSLALEDILMDVINDFIGKENIELIKPSAI